MKNEATREMVLQTTVALLAMGLAVLSLMFMAPLGLGPARKLNFPDERMVPVAGSVTEAVGWMSPGESVDSPGPHLWDHLGGSRLRIPNYLTLGTAVAGLAYNFMGHGLNGGRFPGHAPGIPSSSCPTCGAAWGPGTSRPWPPWGLAGPKLTLFLFCYMGIAGGVMPGYLAWQGILWQKIKAGCFLLNLVLCRPTAPPRLVHRPWVCWSWWGVGGSWWEASARHPFYGTSQGARWLEFTGPGLIAANGGTISLLVCLPGHGMACYRDSMGLNFKCE